MYVYAYTSLQCIQGPYNSSFCWHHIQNHMWSRTGHDGRMPLNFSHEAAEESHEKMCRIDEFESQTVWNVKPTRFERKLLALERLNIFGKKDFGSFPLIPSPYPPLPP